MTTVFRTVSVVTLAIAGFLFPLAAAAQMSDADAHAGPAMNYHKIDERLATGGHFVDGGLDSLHADGVRVVIDLRDNPPTGQKQKLARRGIKWINIPVVWEDPQRADFERFSDAMSAHLADKVLVQCQANYRASAMTYLYRIAVENVPQEIASKDLNAIWEPNERWQDYINSIIE